MAKPLRFGSALSIIALASTVGGCASFGERAGRSSFGKVDMAKVALGTRAQAALAGQDYAAAVDLAEQAVAQTPDDAGFRTLLGNAYFASGRFASAEAAYSDSLTLFAGQPQVILKLALVQIAQGRNTEAAAFLHSARGGLNASDYGLAMALAGQPHEAVGVLENAAREPGADAQLRQNLALAHALAGDWASARIVAAQDLSPDLVDSRVQQWMALSNPAKASDQVAALTGISPAAEDPGQPMRLALRGSDNRMAEAQPAPAEAPAPVQVAEAAPVAEIVPPAISVEEPAPIAAAAIAVPDITPAPVALAAAPIAPPMPTFEAPDVADPVLTAKAPVRKASLPRSGGRSGVVVQLGAYSSRDRVALAWDKLTSKYPGLRGYSPVTARFNSANGTVYRLSIDGFGSEREAIASCRELKGKGGACFVRHVAGDSPVQIASR